MNLPELFEKLITEHGSATILKEHVALIKEQLAAVQKENTALKTENARLASDLQKARSEIELLKPEGFIQRNGVLWREGEQNPYCPECSTHPVMQAVGRPPAPRVWICPHGHPFPRT